MTYISIIYAIITTIIITVYFIFNITYYYSGILNYYKVKEHVKKYPEYKNNQFNKVSFSELIYDFLLIILNSLMIILLWLFLFMQINYQIFYINLLYLILAILLGTIIILYLLYHNYINGVNYNKRGYYINPKIIYGIVTEVILHEDDKRPIISFEYTVNNVKYTNTSDEYSLIYTNYKKNDKIQIIYSSDNNPQYSSIYDETISYYSWIYIILLVIALILLWIFFIYDIYNISL
jgi:hypothetical protein